MDTNRLLKWIVVIVLAIVAWKYGLPWAKERMRGSAASSSSPETSCASAAQHASETWGSGLHRFANPPYDLAAWSDFRGGVESEIARAQTECRCAQQSCETMRGAMNDLRSLVSDFDSAIRNGSPPPDNAVQRQEGIDTTIETAATLARGGK
jgi:hypothetical protein